MTFGVDAADAYAACSDAGDGAGLAALADNIADFVGGNFCRKH